MCVCVCAVAISYKNALYSVISVDLKLIVEWNTILDVTNALHMCVLPIVMRYQDTILLEYTYATAGVFFMLYRYVVFSCKIYINTILHNSKYD